MSNVVFELFAKLGLDSSEYENGLEKSKSLAGSVGGAIGNGLKTMATVGVAAVGAASAAVGAFATSSIKTGAEFDKSMSQVAATMGFTTEQLNATETQLASMSEEERNAAVAAQESFGQLRDFAQEMGRTTAFSASEASEALNYMALAGYDVETSMTMLPNVLNLAAAGNIDLASASDMVTDAQSALGLTLDETSAMVDQMAKTSSKTNTSVAQLGEAMLTIGATARGVKGGTVELSSVLGVLADNGIKGAEGGTHLRNAILSLQTPTKDGVAALEQLGMTYDDMYDASGNLRSLPEIFQQMSTAMDGMTQQSKDAIISGVFNKTDLAAVNALIGTSAERWDEVTAEIEDSKGAAQAMADTQLDNLAGDITLFQSALEGAKIAVSDGLTPSLRTFVKFGTDGLSRLTDAFQKGGVSGAMAEFGNILSDGVKMITDMIPDAIHVGMELIGAVGKGILDNLPAIVDAAVMIAVELANGLVEALPELARGAITILEGLGKAFEENQETIFGIGKTLLDLLINGLMTGVPMLANWAVTAVSDLASYISENGASMAEGAATLIHNLVTGLVENIPELISSAADIIIGLVMALTDPSAITQLVMAAGELIMGLANGLLEALPKLIDAIPQIISNLVAALVAAIPEILFVGIQLIIGLATGLIQAIPRLIAAIPALILALVGGLKRGIEQIVQVGKDMVAGLWKGIKERWSALVEDVMNLGKNLVKGVKGLFGIESPSKVFAEIGRFLDAGLAKGIEDNVGLVDSAIEQLQNRTTIEPQISTISNNTEGNYNDIITLLRDIATSTNKQIVITLDGGLDRLFRVIQRESARNKQITGQEAFT